MMRMAVLVLALMGALATSASAAIFIRLTTTVVHQGGVLRLVGDADHLPIYALPAARMPCARYDTCPAPIHRNRAPRRPFVFLGHTPVAISGTPSTRAFSIRMPRSVRPGRYKIFVWCAACGGSLIVAGSSPSGQTLRVVPRSTG